MTQATQNYKRLYKAKLQREFARRFWKRDLPILLAYGYIGALILLCLVVKFVNELMK
jgi:hypothetical protein